MSYYRYSNASYYRPSFFGGFQFFPPVIKYLLISNVVVFLLTSLIGDVTVGGFSFGSAIAQVFFLYPLGGGFQIWQLFTYMFMHGGFMHLLFNMFALWMFGMELENTWGSKKFLTYYLACGLGAGVSNLLLGPLFGAAGPTVGASGAIYGVLIAFGIMFPTRPIFVYFLLPIQARFFVMFYILLELYAGIKGTSDGIAHFAHLGGFAGGFIYIRLLSRKKNVARFGTEKPSFSPSTADLKRWSRIPRERLHEVNRAELDRIMAKLGSTGPESLTPTERAFLDRFSTDT